MNSVQVNLAGCNSFFFQFCRGFTQDKLFLSVVHLKICPLRTKFVRSRQIVRTCKALGMTENLSKKQLFLLVRIVHYSRLWEQNILKAQLISVQNLIACCRGTQIFVSSMCNENKTFPILGCTANKIHHYFFRVLCFFHVK